MNGKCQLLNIVVIFLLEYFVISTTKEGHYQCGSGQEMLGQMTSDGALVSGRQMAKPWPWMAAFYSRANEFPREEFQPICGASIVDEKFLLIGASCLCKDGNKFVRANYITVKIGLTDIRNDTYAEELKIDKFFVHPKHVCTTNYDYDIALLKLKRPIQFNEFVRPICLPPKDLPQSSTLYKPGQVAVATGWGDTSRAESENSKPHNHLKDIILPIQSPERCLQSLEEQKVFRQIPDRTVFTERMLCAGDGLEEYDACSGYGGSPLMQSQVNTEGNIFWTQIGIVSWGIGCGLPNTYGYYTHVQNLAPWIDSILQRDVEK